MTSQEIAPRSARTVAVSDMRAALEVAGASEAKDLRSHAALYEEWARLHGLRDEYQTAGEAKLWAERRIGELRAASRRYRGDAANLHATRGVGAFDNEVGLDRWHARQYEQLADIPEARFSDILTEIRNADGSYTAHAVLVRDQRTYESRVERGIYKLRDGRLVLQYKRDGIKHRQVLSHDDLPRARAALAVRRGIVKEPHSLYHDYAATVGKATDAVREAVGTVYALDTTPASRESRKAVQEAIAHLHKASDAMLRAVNMWGFSE